MTQAVEVRSNDSREETMERVAAKEYFETHYVLRSEPGSGLPYLAGSPGDDNEMERPTALFPFADPNVPQPPFVIPIPAATPAPTYHFELLQQWECIVVEVGDSDLTAQLRDVSNPALPDEEATFDLAEVSEDDLPLAVEGAVFLWSIGYKTRNGQKERVSLIRFHRLPAWSARAVSRVEGRAAALERSFSGDTS